MQVEAVQFHVFFEAVRSAGNLFSRPVRISVTWAKRMWLATRARMRSICWLEKRSFVRIPSASLTPTSTWPWKRTRSANSIVSGFADHRATTHPRRASRWGFRGARGAAKVWIHTSPSGWCSGDCGTPFILAASGRTALSRPVSSSKAKSLVRRAFGQHRVQFVANPLGRDLENLGRVALDGAASLGFDGKAETRGEANRA